MQLPGQIGKRETRIWPRSLYVKLCVLSERTADQIADAGNQCGALFAGHVVRVNHVQRDGQIVLRFRHGHALHIVAVAVMPLRVDVVIHRINERLGDFAAVEKQIGVGRSGTAWGIVNKENPVNAQPHHARNHAAVHRIGVIVTHQIELVAAPVP